MGIMDEEKSEVVDSDVVEAHSLAEAIPRHSSDVLLTVRSLLDRAKNQEFETSKGISLLNVKNRMMLDYLINITYIIQKKVSGKQIENDDAIERLIESRTVLEKVKPIHEKLKYQIQKLLSVAATGAINTDDPLHFKANPDNLMNEGSDQESDDSGAEVGEKSKPVKSNVYVPPKISATYYDGDETEQTRKQKYLERIRKKALNSSMLQELRKEYDPGPEEIKEVTDLHRQKFNEEMKDRLRYEEEYMMRLPLTKKQRHEGKKVATISSLSTLTKFDDISALDLGPDDLPKQKKRSSKKHLHKNRKRKSFKRKRH